MGFGVWGLGFSVGMHLLLIVKYTASNDALRMMHTHTPHKRLLLPEVMCDAGDVCDV